jgi:hypothetical protein
MKLYATPLINEKDLGISVEVTENQFLIDGYDIRGRQMEGVMFKITFNPETNKVILVENESNDENYLSDFNKEKLFKEISEYAEELLTSDEDGIILSDELKEKYYHPKFGGVADLCNQAPDWR